MYAKLAFRNIRRSLRDYIIYFVTLTLTAALMYSFLALGLSPGILAMTENMSMLTTGILILSVLIAFMSSFVIGYAVRFMLGQRKKEFAAYELMGMEVKTIRNLFLVENGIIGGGCFFAGRFGRNRLIRVIEPGYPEYFRGSAHLSSFVFFPRMGNDTFLFHPDVWIWNVSCSKCYPAAKSD